MDNDQVKYTLFEAGEGSIEAKEHQQERLEELTRRVTSGEFHTHTNGVIVCVCIDGRPGGHIDGPNSSGGSETLMVADDLTAKRFAGADGTTKAAYHSTLAHLKEGGRPIGGHTHESAQGDASGCGANDHLPEIYAYIARDGGQTVRKIAKDLGVEVPDNVHQLIVENASARSQFSKGGELLDELMEAGGDEAVDGLKGPHNEVLLVINNRRGTTLDRKALEAEFGADYQVFNVDAWAFEDSARAISPDDATDEEIQQKVIAMVYYNIATGGVLCGKNMRIVTLE